MYIYAKEINVFKINNYICTSNHLNKNLKQSHTHQVKFCIHEHGYNHKLLFLRMY